MFEQAKAYNGFAVDDLERAEQFYGQTLGLEVSPLAPFGLRLTLPGGAVPSVLMYEKPDFTPASYTILNFEVPDAEAVVDALLARGIEMERYDGFSQDEKGISRHPEFPIGAWFTDPAGNIVCVHEAVPASAA